MLQHWVRPLLNDEYSDYLINDSRLGAKTKYFTENSDLKGVQVALIGIDPDFSNAIRRKLYDFVPHQSALDLLDLGNLRTLTQDSMGALIHELIASNIIPILFGTNAPYLDSQIQGIKLAGLPCSTAIVSQSATHVFSNILEKADTTRLLAHQMHLGKLNKKIVAESLSLGELRDNFEEAEPILRASNSVAVFLDCLKTSELGHPFKGLSTSGLFVEELCRLMRYMGLNEELKSVGISGGAKTFTPDDPILDIYAQLLWYLMEGISNRQIERDDQTSMTEYLVNVQNLDEPMTFYKGTRTGRWWIKTSRGDLQSCSYHDYQNACQNILTKRVFNLFSEL